MNFVDSLKRPGRELMLGNARLDLPAGPAKVAAAQAQGRPADRLPAGAPRARERPGFDAVRFPAEIDVVEYLGNEVLIHAQAEGHEIVALLPSEKEPKVGDKVDLAVPMDQLHIFDPESEKTLVG